MTFEGFAVPDGPVVEIEAWEAAAGATKTVYIPPTSTAGPSTITVRIPPGVVNNTMLRLPGAAAPAGPGLPPGDLVVRVRVRNAPESVPPMTHPISAPPGAYPYPVSAPPGAFGPPGYPVSAPVPPPAKARGTKVALIAVGVVVALLAVCGVGGYALISSSKKNTPSASGSTGSGGGAAASPSPSATPVSEEAYQQALSTLDSAVASGWTQLAAAHNPVAVADAITNLSTALVAQVSHLRDLAPPAVVATAHGQFLDALSAFATDLQSAGADAASRHLCGGSSALASISQSVNLKQARAAAAALATTDAAHPYKVGAWLPAAVAMQNRRAASGTYIKSPARRGMGKIKIQNGGSEDAAVSLAPASGGKAVLTVYVRAKATFTAGRIADGSYNIFITSGSDWDSGAHAFTRDCDFQKFDSPANYRTTRSTYTEYTIGLTPVAGGNASTSGVDPNQFPG